MTRASAMAPMDAAAAEGTVALQHCTACGAGQYPPQEFCHACLSDSLDWTQAPSVPGELLAHATLHHSFVPGTPVPLPVGLVRLERGVTAVCFVAAGAVPGPVSVRASADGEGRAVLTAC